MYKVEMLYQFWNTTANAEKQLLEWLGEAAEKKTTTTTPPPPPSEPVSFKKRIFHLFNNHRKHQF